MTIKNVAALTLVLTGAALFPRQLEAQLSQEWFGTWHLNVAKSTFIGPAPYLRGTWTVTPGDGDQIVMVYHQIGVRGGVTHMEWKGAFDGVDRRIHGPDAAVTYAYRILDARTLDLVVKVDGRGAATARVVLGEDGVVTARTRNMLPGGEVTTVTVYERR